MCNDNAYGLAGSCAAAKALGVPTPIGMQNDFRYATPVDKLLLRWVATRPRPDSKHSAGHYDVSAALMFVADLARWFSSRFVTIPPKPHRPKGRRKRGL